MAYLFTKFCFVFLRQATGEILYNGYRLHEFVPQKTSAYISQEDLHIAEMTVRETLDFSARCQGIGSRADIMLKVSRRENEAGIVPDTDVGTYMKAITVEGLKRTLQTDYVLKVILFILVVTILFSLFVNCISCLPDPWTCICADTMVGDVMRRGISGGKKKRLTTDATALISLLQPAPEAFELFDDIILMAEGKIVYQRPHNKVVEFFEDCGFRCPERKGVADFLQEVISRKDQAQYWTRMDIDLLHASYYMGALFFGLVILLVDGIPELSLTTARLPVFYKQRELRFYPAWAYAIPTAILKIPLSVIESVVWTCLTYYVIGYTPEASRFFLQLILLFAVHLASLSMFQCLASICQTVTAATTAGALGLLFVMIFGGFIITHLWLKWGFWVSPLTHGEIGLSVNEFLAPRWQKMLPTNATIGKAILDSRRLKYEGHLLRISLGALFGFVLLFNTGFVLALSFLKPPGSSRAMISREKFAKILRSPSSNNVKLVEEKTRNPPNQASNKGRMVLPFEPLTLTFQNMNYFVDTPLEMREQGFADKKLQLLFDVTGALRPGVLTALMGVSGAGKTTLLDVLARRKTIGESLIFSAWLRVSPHIDSKTKAAFVNEVLEIIELDEIKDSLVGLPDARAAPIVMRVVKNVVETGRTISITGVPKIKDNYNPATWILELTSPSAEADLNVDFSETYKDSVLNENNKEVVRDSSTPLPDSRDLHFPTRFSQNFWGQFKNCQWKQYLSYWRKPSYNLHQSYTL
ncbi:hypothetical protein Pint_21103 [Pistacia integerrima]|uniref:Uncharacterized protein n=1 Tax=Pistacia integerrima TaxID=434235 RepID=A0ACC0X8J4_9ROSI|nr:hypothetical protein Pint_21103 [Pistacia integerrima]